MNIKYNARKPRTENNHIRSNCTSCVNNLNQACSSNTETQTSKQNKRLDEGTSNIKDLGFGIGKESKFGPTKRLILKEKPIVLALHKAKLHTVSNTWIHNLWGSVDCEFIQREMVGKSGGQLLIWDINYFEATDVISFDCVLGIRGKWKSNGESLNVVNVYGPHDDVRKQKLWDSLAKLVEDLEEAWVLCGDFNEVRNQAECFNCNYIDSRAKRFNDFILSNNMIDISIGGRFFTRVSDDGTKFSKLDRFLVSEKFHASWGILTAIAMERTSSDHCPIVLKNENKYFGPKPFKVFDVWLDVNGTEQVISEAWNKPVTVGHRKDCAFMLRQLYIHIRVRRMEKCEEKWLELESSKSRMLKQKARLKWCLEGDENSRFFHPVIRDKYNRCNIRGLDINGSWNENPKDIKDEAFNHLNFFFQEPDAMRPSLEDLFLPQYY
ncbi:uncharacterized protein [Rutidosis leptorrhynchoides]|uniref:uncharacterized protein n=1 Tax=Rutidosis leptorrhynchoides TaxID=125765 RepID=UPI003A998298